MALRPQLFAVRQSQSVACDAKLECGPLPMLHGQAKTSASVRANWIEGPNAKHNTCNSGHGGDSGVVRTWPVQLANTVERQDRAACDLLLRPNAPGLQIGQARYRTGLRHATRTGVLRGGRQRAANHADGPLASGSCWHRWRYPAVTGHPCRPSRKIRRYSHTPRSGPRGSARHSSVQSQSRSGRVCA